MFLLDQVQDMMNANKNDSVEHQFASYVIHHYSEMDVITIQDVAQACHTSLSTITRIVQRMGYESYKDFRLECLDVAESAKDPRIVSRYMRSNPLTPSNVRAYLEDTLAPVLERISEDDMVKMASWLSETPLYMYGISTSGALLHMIQNQYTDRSIYILHSMKDLIRLNSTDTALIVTTTGNVLRLDETPGMYLRQCKGKRYLLTTSQFLNIPAWFDDKIILQTAVDDGLTNDLLLIFFIRMTIFTYR